LGFVLTVATQDPTALYLALLTHLTAEGIALCGQADYEAPNSLIANQLYCIAGDPADAYQTFQCLPVPDWEGEPVPNFTTVVGRFQWLLVPAPP
jgi:hypothetical protein